MTTDIQPVEIEIVRVCTFKKKDDDPDTGKTRRGCANCGKNKGDWDHMGQPPSMNIFGSGNPMHFQTIKKAWHALLLAKVEESGLPKWVMEGAMVEGEVTFPRRASARGPDQGNFRAPLEKILGDVLEEGGWIPNDNWERYQFGGLAYNYEKGVSRTRLLIFPVMELQALRGPSSAEPLTLDV